MKTKYFFLFLILNPLFITAQINSKEQNFFMDKSRNVNDYNYLKDNNTVGDLYLDDWQLAKIYPKGSTSAWTQYKARYFVYKQEIHLTNKIDTVLLAKSFSIDSISIDNKIFIYTSYDSNGKTKNSYFQELSNGSVRLLKKYTCFFIKGNQKTATGYEMVVHDKYKIESKYYYQHMNEPAQLLPKSKKEILNLLNESKLAGFVKKNKLKLKREKDLIKLFQYYNTL